MNYISLYSGCGGADTGFHKNGFNNLGCFDIDKAALKVLQKNLNVPVFNVDLTVGNVPKIIGNKNIDVVFSGAPCQGFSTAGNRIYSDPRNNLLVRGGEIALELNTKVFVSENVMGSLSGKMKDYWDILDKLFLSNGYKTEFIKVNCLDIGMAQMRKRVLFFAWKGSAQNIRWPHKKNSKRLGEVLSDIELCTNNEGYILSIDDHKLKIASKIGPTQKLCNVRGGNRAVATWDIPEVFGEVNTSEKQILKSIRNLRRRNRTREIGDADPVEMGLLVKELGHKTIDHIEVLEKKGYLRRKTANTVDLTRTFNGKYRRLSLDEPCTTVDTRFGNPIYFLHPLENRGFTVREAARIQGFPDDFTFEGTLQEKFRMIGNAVPPPLSDIVAKIVKEQLLRNE
jgi:DNA (cytosine-5)-methyltransferase 1